MSGKVCEMKSKILFELHNHCQGSKIHRAVTRTKMLITDTPLDPFEKVSIDTEEPLKTTSRGNRQLLTMPLDKIHNCRASE